MYILYLDESGVQEANAGTSHFVLLGLAVRLDQWKTIDANIERLKGEFGLSTTEIHAHLMARRFSEQEQIDSFDQLTPEERRTATEHAMRGRAGKLGVLGRAERIKAYRRECRSIRPYIHLTRSERLECLDRLATELAGWAHARIFADAVSKSDFSPGRLLSPYEMAFEQVVTRFQTFLAKLGDMGLMVSDNNDTAAPRLTELSRKFHRDGTVYRDIVNIVETPLFVDSGLTSMIQMADLCAYALRRYIENGEERLWRIVRERVDRQAEVHVGVRHYTGKRQCNCQVCIDHGRRPALGG